MFSKISNFYSSCSFCLLCAICSCTYPKHLDIAKQKTDKYYFWFERDHIDSVFTLFKKDYFLEADSLSLVEELRKIRELGAIVTRDYNGSTQETKIETGGKVLYITVKYKVKYSDSTILDEQFQYMTNDEYSDVLYRLNIKVADE